MCWVPPEAGVTGYCELLDVCSGNWTQHLCKNKTSFNWWCYFISLDSFKIEWFRVNFFCCLIEHFIVAIFCHCSWGTVEESRIWCWALSSGKFSANGVWGFYLLFVFCVCTFIFMLCLIFFWLKELSWNRKIYYFENDQFFLTEEYSRHLRMLGDLPVTVVILNSSLFSCKSTKIKKQLLFCLVTFP